MLMVMEVMDLTFEEAIEEIRDHSILIDFRPRKGLEALRVIYAALKDYRIIKKENRELKRLLRLAVEDFQNVEEVCAGVSLCGLCPANNNCKWKRYDEAMKLIGVNENE